MIKGWKSRRYQRFHETGDAKGLNPEHIGKLKRVAAALERATTPKSMFLPGFRCHELRNEDKGRWAVKISANYRVTFVFVGTDVDEVDYKDYH